MLAAQRRAADVGVGGERPEGQRIAIDGDAAEIVDRPQVDDAGRRRAELAGQRHHEVGAARDRADRGLGRARGQCRVRPGKVARAGDGRLDRHRVGWRPSVAPAAAPAEHEQDDRRDDPEARRELGRRDARDGRALTAVGRDSRGRGSSPFRASWLGRIQGLLGIGHRRSVPVGGDRDAVVWWTHGAAPPLAARAMASTILVYPVHRHRLPAINSRMASSSGPPPASR